MIELAKTERALGCSFIALSRVRSLQNVMLQPIAFQRLHFIGKTKQIQERIREEERLINLAQIAALQYRQHPLFNRNKLI